MSFKLGCGTAFRRFSTLLVFRRAILGSRCIDLLLLSPMLGWRSILLNQCASMLRERYIDLGMPGLFVD